MKKFVPGTGGAQLSYAALCVDGEPIASASAVRLRQRPMDFGKASSHVQTIEDGDAAAQARRLLRALRYTGVVEVEFKRDARDGRFKLMEINARLWQWHGLAAACGADPVQAAYLDLTGRHVGPVTSNGRRTRWAIALVPHERPLFVHPPDVEAVFALDDLRPGVTHLARFARNSLR